MESKKKQSTENFIKDIRRKTRRLMMLVVGPVIGLISGLVLGLFAFIASKIVKKKEALPLQ